MREPCFRCTVCGKYMSYQDIANDKIIREYTPDSEFSAEKIEMTHKQCKNKLDEKALVRNTDMVVPEAAR